MTQPWVAEKEVDSTLARALILEQFPQIAVEKLRPFGSGWDNTAYLVNDSLVFRFPRKKMSVSLLEQETKFLPMIASQLSFISTSAPLYVGRPSPEFPWPFAGYPIVRGRSLEFCHLTPWQRRGLTRPLARFLRTLHSIPVPPEMGPDPMGRFHREPRLVQFEKRIATLREGGVEWLSQERLRLWQEILEVDLSSTGPEVIVHGDLYCRHMIFDDKGALTGIIDWGDLHCGAPANDLAAALVYLEPNSLTEFMTLYPASRACWAKAYFRALTHSIAVCCFAFETKQQALFDEVKRGLLSLEISWPQTSRI